MTQTVDKELCFQGGLLSVEQHTWQVAGGSRVKRLVVRAVPAVLIVPVLPDGRLVLIRNRRIAVDQTLLEFPAGAVEPGEQVMETARRELCEETGYHSDSLEQIGRFYTSPGFSDELMHVFVARELIAGDQQLEAHEQIEVDVLSSDAVLELIREGMIRDGKTIAALFLHRQLAGGGAA